VPQPLQALLLRPADLADRLAVPLEETLARTTPKPAAFKPDVPEAQTVELLTGSNLFEAAFQQGQDAKAHLVLSRPLVVK
jgi:hypothetical protein